MARAAAVVQLHVLSIYCKLDAKLKARYLEKVSLIKKEDPYALKKADLCRDASQLPSLASDCHSYCTAARYLSQLLSFSRILTGDILLSSSYPDIVVYLLYTTSFVTLEEVKNYKSLQSYKYFTSG